VTTPIEGRYFTGADNGRINRFFMGIYNSRLMLKMIWFLATLRRKLRVKVVGDF